MVAKEEKNLQTFCSSVLKGNCAQSRRFQGKTSIDDRSRKNTLSLEKTPQLDEDGDIFFAKRYHDQNLRASNFYLTKCPKNFETNSLKLSLLSIFEGKYTFSTHHNFKFPTINFSLFRNCKQTFNHKSNIYHSKNPRIIQQRKDRLTSQFKKTHSNYKRACKKYNFFSAQSFSSLENVGQKFWPSSLRLLDLVHELSKLFSNRIYCIEPSTKFNPSPHQHLKYNALKNHVILSGKSIYKDKVSQSQNKEPHLIKKGDSQSTLPNKLIIVELGCGIGVLGPVLSDLIPPNISCTTYLTDADDFILELTHLNQGRTKTCISFVSDEHHPPFNFSQESYPDNLENFYLEEESNEFHVIPRFQKLGNNVIKCRKFNWNEFANVIKNNDHAISKLEDSFKIIDSDLFKNFITKSTNLDKNKHIKENTTPPDCNPSLYENRFLWDEFELNSLFSEVSIFVACDVLYDFKIIDIFSSTIHTLLHWNPSADFYLIQDIRLNFVNNWNLEPQDIFVDYFRDHYVDIVTNDTILFKSKSNLHYHNSCSKSPPYFDIQIINSIPNIYSLAMTLPQSSQIKNAAVDYSNIDQIKSKYQHSKLDTKFVKIWKISLCQAHH